MTRLFFLALFFVGQSCLGQENLSFGKPVFWFTVSDPWAIFMGADGPPFILYDNGKILFWKSRSYNVTQLDKDEMLELIDELGLKDTLFRKSRFYNATNPDPNGEIMATDNPSYGVFVNLDTLVNVSVYGDISSKEYQKRFPQQVRKIHDFVLYFEADRYRIWIPEKIELMLSDYSHSPETPIPWPKNWPDLSSPDTRRQRQLTIIYLDKKYLSQLNKLLKARREKQAFEINGRKFNVGYRYPIPGLY